MSITLSTPRATTAAGWYPPANDGQRGTLFELVECDRGTGLGVQPSLDRQRRFTGRWQVIHLATGLAVGLSGAGHVPRGMPLGFARDAVTLLTRTGIDWTQPRYVLLAQGARATVRDVAAQLEWHITRGIPLDLAVSWTVTRIPASLLDDYDPHFDDADPVTVWRLRCGLCADMPSDGEWSLYQEDAAVDAADQNWTPVTGDSWLCPVCSPPYGLTT